MNPDSPSVLTYRNRYRNKSPVQTKYEALKDSIKTVGKEYCSESSICGLKHLVNNRTTPIERYAPDVKVLRYQFVLTLLQVVLNLFSLLLPV